jgi:hypothetical protein
MNGQTSEAIVTRLTLMSQQLDRLATSVDSLNTLTAKLWVVTCGDGQGLVDRVNLVENRLFADNESIVSRLAKVEQALRRIGRILEAVLTAMILAIVTAVLNLVLR